MDTGTVDAAATFAGQAQQALVSTDFSIKVLPSPSTDATALFEPSDIRKVTKAPKTNPPTFELETLPVFEDGFDIVGRVGKGGMGVVLKVFDRNTGAELAAKFSLSNSPSSLIRFKKEIAIAAKLTKTGFSSASSVFRNSKEIRLSSELIIPAQSIGYSMRLVDGVPFSDIIRIYHQCILPKREQPNTSPAKKNYEGILLRDYLGIERPIEELTKRHLDLMLKRIMETHILVCRSVEVMHKEGLIHRDLKPDNVLVERNTWNAILLDYGLAREGIGNDSSGKPAKSGPSFPLDRTTANDTATQGFR